MVRWSVLMLASSVMMVPAASAEDGCLVENPVGGVVGMTIDYANDRCSDAGGAPGNTAEQGEDTCDYLVGARDCTDPELWASYIAWVLDQL